MRRNNNPADKSIIEEVVSLYWSAIMTEWYHNYPYYNNEESAIYTQYGQGIASAWFWIEEFTCSNTTCYNKTSIFSDITYSPITFNNSKLYSFNYQGANEYANSTYFITGLIQQTNHNIRLPFNASKPIVQSTSIERIYLGHNLTTGPFVVQLDALSNSGLSSVSVYEDGLLLYRGGIFAQQTATLNTNLGRVIVYVNNTQLGTYVYQKWANIQLIIPNEPITTISTTVPTSTITYTTTSSAISSITSTIIPTTSILQTAKNTSSIASSNNTQQSAGSLALSYTIIALAIFAVLYISFRIYKFVRSKIRLKKKKT